MAYTNIDDPSAYFQVSTWTGNATNRTIDLDSNSTMQPDFSWVKSRSNAYEHYLQNSSTGTDKYLRSNSSAAQQNGTIVTYNSTGFGIGSGAENNQNSTTNVGWFWKVNGGTTSTMTGGNINSVVQANQDAGFSIVTYTGNGAVGQAVNHGLGATPQMFIIKRTDGTADWFVYHQAMGNTKHLHLNTTAAESTTSDFGNYGPDVNNFYVNNTGTCINNENYIAYCFAEKQGYSKFGSYVGNGNTNGTFVYTGFKPAFVMIKNIDNSAGQWYMYDNRRDESNVMEQALQAQGTNAEITTSNKLDFVSNGIKHRGSNVTTNQNGSTHIYMAFAENPFVTSTGIPTTAR